MSNVLGEMLQKLPGMAGGIQKLFDDFLRFEKFSLLYGIIGVVFIIVTKL